MNELTDKLKGKEMTNFEILQEYEKAGVPLPRLETITKLKNQNKRLREIIEVCQRYFDNQRVTDAWADNIKMDIDDTMGDLGMDELK